MRRPPAVPEFVPLLGLHVRTARGVYIGRVNDVDFDPESGAVAAVFYDEYGLSWLPPGVVNLFGVPTDAVLSVRPPPALPPLPTQLFPAVRRMPCAAGTGARHVR